MLHGADESQPGRHPQVSLHVTNLSLAYKYRGSVSDMAFLFALASGLILKLDQLEDSGSNPSRGKKNVSVT